MSCFCSLLFCMLWKERKIFPLFLFFTFSFYVFCDFRQCCRSEDLNPVTLWYRKGSLETQYRNLPDPEFHYYMAGATVIFVCMAILQALTTPGYNTTHKILLLPLLQLYISPQETRINSKIYRISKHACWWMKEKIRAERRRKSYGWKIEKLTDILFDKGKLHARALAKIFSVISL